MNKEFTPMRWATGARQALSTSWKPRRPKRSSIFLNSNPPNVMIPIPIYRTRPPAPIRFRHIAYTVAIPLTAILAFAIAFAVISIS